MSDKRFGDCCKDLSAALNEPPTSFFRLEDNGVLYLTVGYMMTDKGPGFFDQAVLYCPFCGTQIQTETEIRKRAGASVS